jgi:hypothetical protein
MPLVKNKILVSPMSLIILFPIHTNNNTIIILLLQTIHWIVLEENHNESKDDKAI